MNLGEIDALTNQKKRYQITVMQPKEEAAASADFPSSTKWISDYGGKNQKILEGKMSHL